MDLKRTLETLRDRHMAQIDDFARDALEDELARLRMLRIAEEALGFGDHLPDFRLYDGFGTAWSSGALLDRGPLVLAFFRGGWCPYCAPIMTALDRSAPALRALGASVAGIVPDVGDAVRHSASERGLTYPLLIDPANAYAELCGLVYELSPDHVQLHRDRKRDLAAMHGERRWRLPIPAVYVIDRKGDVVFAFTDVDPANWPDPEALIATLDRLAAP